MIEYLPWYNPGEHVLRCLSCGSMIGSGDTETHTSWHEAQDTRKEHKDD